MSYVRVDYTVSYVRVDYTVSYVRVDYTVSYVGADSENYVRAKIVSEKNREQN